MCAIAFTLLMLLAISFDASAKCQLGRLGELSLTMAGLRPLVSVKFNDQDAKLVLDSGAFFSMITAATAGEYKLKLSPAPYGLRVEGIGGYVETSVTNVKDFSVAGVTFHKVDFLVGGSEVGAAGLLGQNFLAKLDVEYDFANGMARLFRAEDCKNELLAYWVKPGQSFSQMEIEREGRGHFHTVGVAYVNGMKIRVKFDTGAWTSLLSIKAAERAGIKIDSPGVVDAGYARGVGRGTSKQYIAPVASFKIGDSEEIKNTRLRIADVELNDADMLLGADFFVSHRVYVANSEHKLYLTYNGGAVFNLAKAPPVNEPAAPIATDDADAAHDSSKAEAKADVNPADAAELARLGEALAARRDFEHALTDLSKAVELGPDEPEYRYRRALVYQQNGQSDLALADLDRVLMLKEDFLLAYIPRAQIRLRNKNVTGAIADLDAADRLAAKQADLRLTLAGLYEAADQIPVAMKQYDLWIQNHPVDSRIAAALSARCLASALQNQDLEGGLDSCNRALNIADKKNSSYSYILVNRGLVRLRQKYYDKAISDFEAAVKMIPNNARALYGRGVAKTLVNKTAEGAADMDAAVKIAPNVAEQFKRRGFTQ
jgi:tetratricopeptide (TPR) repeat protein/predicted aspartyl protease